MLVLPALSASRRIIRAQLAFYPNGANDIFQFSPVPAKRTKVEKGGRE